MPVGVPIPWPSAKPPTGWLKCNGAAFTAEQYPELALAYPALKLPDLRGEFIRGWDDGRGVDAERTIFSTQSGSKLIRDVVGESANNPVNFSSRYTNIDLGWDAYQENISYETTYALKNAVFSAGRIYLGTARPRNIAFNYIVRAA